MAAFFHSIGTHLDYTPTSDTAAGVLVAVGGVTGIVNNDIVANTLGAVTIRGAIALDKASGTVFADGAAVNYNVSTGLGVTTAVGAGILAAGTCVGASGASGSLSVVVLLSR
jgi:predicted RecA/RadA family phage recombinase